ncbi:hypothetical protein XccvBFoX4_gp54c [Xanthomonas phage FoX4]|uniref:Uncharacterized protein n=1 Tax=Xanthomonas phage FoX4 TaxID=2723900 RepID=A0A858WP26_9CAUD|nr:hypothetical protein KNU97_gp54 [Xanthomonas phage FoX4]QJI53008.1 hypothetical protein XccvBFoX4_gp54c [Xanthomonas phage FoX4]
MAQRLSRWSDMRIQQRRSCAFLRGPRRIARGCTFA